VYRRILVPMESDRHQAPALAHARLLARSLDATVILAWLVTVVPTEEYFMRQVQVEPGSSGARRKAQGEAFLQEAGEEFRSAGIDTVTRIVITSQPPEQAIIDLAIQEGVDLILLATLPQSAVGRFLLGSVGEKVRRRSPVPVLSVGPTTADLLE